MAEGLLAENVHGFIVEDEEGAVGLCFDKAIVAIGVVGIEGDICDDAHRRAGGLDGADEAGDEAIGVVALGGIGGFEGVVGFRKQHHGGDADFVEREHFGYHVFFAPTGDAGHGGDGIVLRAFLDEEGLDEVAGAEHGFTDERADGGAAAVAAGTDGKVHGGDFFVREAGGTPALRRAQFIAVLAIFDGPAEGGELVAEDIGLSPVFGLADGEALLGEGADLGGDFDLLFRFRQGEAEGTEDAVEAGEGLGGSEAVELGGLAQAGEDGTEGAGGVEVVVEGVPRGLEGAELDAGEHGIFRRLRGELLRGFGHLVHGFARGVEAIEGEIERFAVVAAEQDVAHLHGGPAVFGEVFEGVEVAERLGHFSAIDHQVRDVEPSGGEVPAAGAAALGDFVFVVREDEIDAAAVEVESFAEVLADHRGALEVPAGSAFAPGGGPEIFAILGAAGLPEHEVADALFFVFIGIGALGLGATELELAFIEVGELAVFRKGGDVEIDRAVLGGVGVAFGNECLDHGDLLGDVLDGTGFDVWREALEEVAVVMEFFRPEAGELRERLADALGFADRFVIDIGEVADMERAQAAGFEGTAEDILEDEGAEIADVGGAIDRGAAAVKAESLAIEWRDFLDFTCQGVEESHGFSLACALWSGKCGVGLLRNFLKI